MIAFNFSVSLNGGGSQCFAINAATASGQAKSIGVSFVTSSSTRSLSDFGVKFLLGSTQYIYSSNVCSGWTSLGSWPSSFNNYASTSNTCNEMWSQSSLSSLSAGFTEVCVVNTCGACSCADYVNFAGQLKVFGYSTTTALSTGTLYNPRCAVPSTVKGRYVYPIL